VPANPHYTIHLRLIGIDFFVVLKKTPMITTEKITPHLWFDRQAEEAARYYCSIFKDSEIVAVNHYTDEGFEIHKMPAGTVLTVEFLLEGQRFVALNGGPIFKFNESISFMINCQTQDEIDSYWDKLTSGGDPAAQQCGWLKDRFGVSWQVAPVQLRDMMLDKDQKRFNRVMSAMLKMKKLDLTKLEAAYHGKVLA
jgi:predicted 3-demethylubiquinone-9 3-methyltransferase (glyoxalase superfamily)